MGGRAVSCPMLRVSILAQDEKLGQVLKSLPPTLLFLYLLFPEATSGTSGLQCFEESLKLSVMRPAAGRSVALCQASSCWALCLGVPPRGTVVLEDTQPSAAIK